MATTGNMSDSYITPENATPTQSPFLDIASTKIPKTIKETFQYVEHILFSQSLVSSALKKKSLYPITSLVYDEDPNRKEFIESWKTILEGTLEFPEFFETINLNYYLYGNCFLSLRYPIIKYFTCKACNYTDKFSKVTKYTVQDHKLGIENCPRCGKLMPDITLEDKIIKDKNKIKLILWDPKRIGIRFEKLTGESTYEYAIPIEDRNAIRNKLKTTKEISKIEQIYIDAALSEDMKVVVFADGAIFHMKSPSIAGIDPAWGYPHLLSLTKDVYYIQTLKKANEAVMNGHMVPYRYLFPVSPPDATVPFGGINLAVWRSFMKQELSRYKQDPNYISVFPFQVGQGAFGGQGRSLLAQQELGELGKYLLAGAGVPQEFVFGGLQWSGTNISLRMLENEFLRIRKYNIKILYWLIDKLSIILNKPPIKVHFSEFKMADDAQRKSSLVNFNQTGNISLSTTLTEFDLDAEKEIEKRKSEAKKLAAMKKEEMMEMAKVEVEVQIYKDKLMRQYQEQLMQDNPGAPPMVDEQGNPIPPGQPQPGQTGQGVQQGQKTSGQSGQPNPGNQQAKVKPNPEQRPPRGPGSQV